MRRTSSAALVMSFLALVGCSQGDINVVGVAEFSPPHELYEGYITPPRLFLTIEGGEENERCSIDFPKEVLDNQQEIDESGLVPTITVKCDYDGEAIIGGPVTSEYDYIKLSFKGQNQAVVSFKAKLVVFEDDYYHAQTVEPLEFTYSTARTDG